MHNSKPSLAFEKKLVAKLLEGMGYDNAQVTPRGNGKTTSGFSSGTIKAANELGAAPITLIDGPKLVELLIEHGIGVRKKPIELWELDAGAFSGDDEELGSDS